MEDEVSLIIITSQVVSVPYQEHAVPFSVNLVFMKFSILAILDLFQLFSQIDWYLHIWQSILAGCYLSNTFSFLEHSLCSTSLKIFPPLDFSVFPEYQLIMSLYNSEKKNSHFTAEESQALKNLQKHIQVFWLLKYMT